MQSELDMYVDVFISCQSASYASQMHTAYNSCFQADFTLPSKFIM